LGGRKSPPVGKAKVGLVAAGAAFIPVGGHFFAAPFQRDGIRGGAFGFLFGAAGVLGFATFGADFVAVCRRATWGAGGATLATGLGAGFGQAINREAELEKSEPCEKTNEFHD
jgi:hypothetical protein